MLLIKEDLYDSIIDDLPEPVNNDWSEKDFKKNYGINKLMYRQHIDRTPKK